jgi:hypothetical protein
MVTDKALAPNIIFLVMLGSIMAELFVLWLFIETTPAQIAGLIALELFSLAALMFAGRYYYIARDDHDRYEAAEMLFAALNEEERAALKSRMAQKKVSGRVKFHLRQILGETA